MLTMYDKKKKKLNIATSNDDMLMDVFI
jgi:hypothetical protein